jgi:hypothetical protein
MLITPASQEVELGGLQFKASLVNPTLKTSWVCNPNYSGGRDQEDGHSKSALDKQFERPYLEKYPTQGWWSGSSSKNTCLASMRS